MNFYDELLHKLAAADSLQNLLNSLWSFEQRNASGEGSNSNNDAFKKRIHKKMHAYAEANGTKIHDIDQYYQKWKEDHNLGNGGSIRDEYAGNEFGPGYSQVGGQEYVKDFTSGRTTGSSSTGSSWQDTESDFSGNSGGGSSNDDWFNNWWKKKKQQWDAEDAEWDRRDQEWQKERQENKRKDQEWWDNYNKENEEWQKSNDDWWNNFHSNWEKQKAQNDADWAKTQAQWAAEDAQREIQQNLYFDEYSPAYSALQSRKFDKLRNHSGIMAGAGIAAVLGSGIANAGQDKRTEEAIKDYARADGDFSQKRKREATSVRNHALARNSAMGLLIGGVLGAGGGAALRHGGISKYQAELEELTNKYKGRMGTWDSHMHSMDPVEPRNAVVEGAGVGALFGGIGGMGAGHAYGYRQGANKIEQMTDRKKDKNKGHRKAASEL